MCGIVGGVAERSITNILIEGLKRLEYRGYDSAGLALVNQGQVLRERRVGKVSNLEEAVNQSGILGSLGIAHTRWATHGKPTEDNAHNLILLFLHLLWTLIVFFFNLLRAFYR
jgi:glutamine---fructose-6-phosphate transaminase (isomerizing)